MTEKKRKNKLRKLLLKQKPKMIHVYDSSNRNELGHHDVIEVTFENGKNLIIHCESWEITN